MKLSCGHWSPVAANIRTVGTIMECAKCACDMRIISVRQLKDTAKTPYETRRAKDLAAYAVAKSRPANVAARYWHL